MKKLSRKFFSRKPEIVARELLGKILVHKTDNKIYKGIIVETEAYLGYGDTASHSYRGITKRNEVMFGKAGIAYIYFTYGIHWLLNFITEEEGKPSGVLIRAIEPLDNRLSETQKIKFGSGPARFTKWMNISGEMNKEDITVSKKLYVVDAPKIGEKDFVARPRVGIDYAKSHKDLLLRFYIKGNKYISKN